MGPCTPSPPAPRRRRGRVPALLFAVAVTAAAAAALVVVPPSSAATVSETVAHEAPSPPPAPSSNNGGITPLVLPIGQVATLTSANFTAAVAPPLPALTVVAFKVPWCGHCQALTAPFAAVAATLVSTQPNVRLAAVDASAKENAALNSAHVSVGYPTIKAFSAGVLVDEFRGVRDEPHLTAWMDKIVYTSGRSPVVALAGRNGGSSGLAGRRTGPEDKKKKKSKARKVRAGELDAEETLESLLAEGPPILALLDRSTASPALAAAFEAAVAVLRTPPLDLPLARFASTPRLADEPAVEAAAATAPAVSGEDGGVGVPPLPPASDNDVAVLWRRSLTYGSKDMSLIRRLRVRDAAAVAAGSLTTAADARAGGPPPPPTEDAVAAVAAWVYDAAVHPMDAFLVDAGNLAMLTGAPAPLLLAFGPDALPARLLSAVLFALPASVHPPPHGSAADDGGTTPPGGRTVGRLAYVQRGAFPDLDAHVLAGSDDDNGSGDHKRGVDWAVYRRGARRVERCVFGAAAWSLAVTTAGTEEVAASKALAATLAAWSAACAAGALDADPMAGVVHSPPVKPSGVAYVASKTGSLSPAAASTSATTRLAAAAANLTAGVRELGGLAGWRPWVDNADGLVVAWLVPAAGCTRPTCAAQDAVVRAAAAVLENTTDAVSVVRLPIGAADSFAVAANMPPSLRRALDGHGHHAVPALLLLSADPAVPDIVLRGRELDVAVRSAAALVQLALTAAEPRPLGAGTGVVGGAPGSTARAADSNGMALGNSVPPAGGTRGLMRPVGLLFGWLLVAATAGLLGVEVAGGRAAAARVVRASLAPTVRWASGGGIGGWRGGVHRLRGVSPVRSSSWYP
ncbi:hypothetical protein MMPV_003090 [Pyropia vietnamensis]